MKRNIALLMSLLMSAACLTACGGDEGNKVKTDNYYKITINENTLAFAIAPLSKEEYISKVGDKDE